jgi:putative membrane protein (TIGR04086 family)
VAAGFFTVRPSRKNGLALGGLTALPQALLILLLSAVISGGAPGLKSAVLLGVMLLGGAMGGIAAANMRGKTKKTY